MSCVKEYIDSLPDNEKERIIFAGIVGSYNTKTATESSDYDVQCYSFPTLRSLLEEKSHTKASRVGKFDFQNHDIRKLYDFFVYGDINKTGILYNADLYINPDYRDFVNYLIRYREELSSSVQEAMKKWVYRLYVGRLTVLDYFHEYETVPSCGYNAKGLRQVYLYISLLGRYYLNVAQGVENPMLSAMDCNDITDECKKIDAGAYDREYVLHVLDAKYKTLLPPHMDKDIRGLNEKIYNFVETEIRRGIIF